MKEIIGDFNIVRGSNAPKILVVCDAPSEGIYEVGGVMGKPHMKLFGDVAERSGFSKSDFVMISPCSPVPEINQTSAGRLTKWIAEDHEGFCSAVDELLERYDIKAVLSMGKIGNQQLANKSVAITKARGTFRNYEVMGDLPVLPIFSPSHVLTRPENREIFESDFLQLRSLRESNWSVEEHQSKSGNYTKYKWCLDLSYFLKNPPVKMAVDCETVGLGWHKEGFRVLTVAFTTADGNAFVVPTDEEYWNDESVRGESSKDLPKLTRRQIARLRKDLKRVLGNPATSVVGHNLSFDIHALRTLGIDIGQWFADTIQLAFAVDENMQSKSLADCTRRWVPSMSGYSDDFDQKTDKSRMQDVDHDDMLEYAGGDTDATFQLAKVLLPMAKADSRNWRTFTHIQMPALRAFVEMEENGVLIDKDELRKLEENLGQKEIELYQELIDQVPPKVLRRHEGQWSFSRADFIRDILFSNKSQGGRGITPMVFTKTTAMLPPDEQKASTSAKDHLAFFDDDEFVHKLISYLKLSKMRSTYVGKEPSEEEKEVKPLKNGGMPKRISDVLLQAGIDVGKSKAIRRRRRVIDLGLENEKPPFRDIAGANGSIFRVDKFGNVVERKMHQPTGFWQYLEGSDHIHPSFLLHGTVTGRTSSRGPNAQNFPKRGDLAKLFRKIFVAPAGQVLLEADLSQAELRVAAWMAGELEMIRIYESGGDIHSATAAEIVGVSEDKFNAGIDDTTPLADCLGEWPESPRYLRDNPTSKLKQEDGTFITVPSRVCDFLDYKRFQAKAVNFGFLYGMGWRGFKRYAKLDYGIDLTDEEAQEMRIRFFRKYPRLLSWHEGMRDFVNSNQYVRSLHGALRRLPSVNSDDQGVAAMAVRQAINSPVQRFGSDLGLIGLHRFMRDCPKDLAALRLFIHDANIVSCDEDRAMEVASALKFYMQTSPLKKWFGIEAPFPILADVSMGPNLCDMADLKGIEAIEPEWYRSGEQAPYSYLEDAWRIKKRRQIILTDS